MIEICEQKNPDLTELAKKTKVILTTVGPYALYGEPVVQACVEAGTHYLDVYAASEPSELSMTRLTFMI